MRAVLDTNVVIAGDFGDFRDGDFDVAVTSLTYAELAWGVSAAPEEVARAVRGAALQRAQKILGPGLPFDDDAAASYGHITALIRARGRDVRPRAIDLMIAAIAHANDAAVVTHNVRDFAGLEGLVEVIPA